MMDQNCSTVPLYDDKNLMENMLCEAILGEKSMLSVFIPLADFL